MRKTSLGDKTVWMGELASKIFLTCEDTLKFLAIIRLGGQGGEPVNGGCANIHSLETGPYVSWIKAATPVGVDPNSLLFPGGSRRLASPLNSRLMAYIPLG